MLTPELGLQQRLQKELGDAKELYYWSLNEMKKHVQVTRLCTDFPTEEVPPHIYLLKL